MISYLKYVPSAGGKWGRGGERYARTMPNYTTPSILSNIEMLSREYPQYVFRSRTLNISMSAVPNDSIAECYFPEKKLQELFKARKRDSLQEEVVELVSLMSSKVGIPKDDFGITGSILTDIYNPAFSDIDLTIYGRENIWKMKRALRANPEDGPLRRPSEEYRRKALGRWVKEYPLNRGEAEAIYARRWNYGRFEDRIFSIHGIRKEEEITEKYGDMHYFPRGMVEGTAKIVDAHDSLFLPCIYGVEAKTGSGEVAELVTYDGMYAGMFDEGEAVAFCGKLELATDKRGGSHFRVLVGSTEAGGRDYIKPLI